ncbi:hypothetical protein JQX13_15855 [Archangium violaceum]|uniref:hypothetical protein n=1 Tax=Archangium violaceum TaxID=83451 RepID=UPI00193B9A55|nr:hypothetical protein [Archangium violaceum]QRK11412.1 hypothetical protein JQX13_15855 [Archangium violaceum]
MTEAYNDALSEQLRQNVWERFKSEAANMSALEKASVSADIIGIFDPTPTSDAVGFVLSAAQGDALGALLSLGGMVPYVGDALAKPIKIAKYAPRTAKALEAMLKAGDNLAKASAQALKQRGLSLEQVAAARKKALERVQQAMQDAKKKTPGCEDCKKLKGDKGENRRRHMPKSGENGRWRTPDGKQPADGNGIFEFTEPKKLPDGTEVKQLEFRDGAPNFDKYVEGGKHNLWEVSGDAKIDGDRLKAMMRENNPAWEPPSSKDYVLHHFESGEVGYVPRALHDVQAGGVAHTGGNSMVNNELF